MHVPPSSCENGISNANPKCAWEFKQIIQDLWHVFFRNVAVTTRNLKKLFNNKRTLSPDQDSLYSGNNMLRAKQQD